jgi:hypothetical protein
LLGSILNGGSLTQFASSSDPLDHGIYIVDSGKFLPVSTINGLINAGVSGQNVAKIASSAISSNLAASVWQGCLATDGSGSYWVLDSGTKRLIGSQYLTAWQTGQATTLSSSYLSLLESGSDMTDAVISPSSPTVFGIKNGQKYGIPTPDTYTQSGLGPITTVSDNLLNTIPTGGVWVN